MRFDSYAILVINFVFLVYPDIKCIKFGKNNVKIYNNSIKFKFWDVEIGTLIQIVMHSKPERK